jgi:hypothetical protein
MQDFIMFIIYVVSIYFVFTSRKTRSRNFGWVIGSVLIPFIVPIIYFLTLRKQSESPSDTVEKQTAATYETKVDGKGIAMRPFHTNVAGINHANSDGSKRQDILSRCYVGEKLDLVREPENIYDANAVKVCTLKGKQIGFLHRDEAAEITPRLDKGSPVDTEIVEIVPDDDLNVKRCVIKLTKYRMR